MEMDKQRKNLIILALIVVALLAVVGYQWWSASVNEVVPVTRTVRDFIVNWECLDCGERREERAGPGPIHCDKCGKDQMYATIQWACPQHGGQRVFFQYSEAGKPTQYRFKSGEWTPAFDARGGWNVHCPQCNSIMIPAEAPKLADEPAATDN